MISMKRKTTMAGLALALVIVLVGGCAKTTVTPPPSPATPTSPPAKSTPAATLTSSPAASPTRTVSAWDKWKADYDAEIAKLVAGAKQEGAKLTVYMPAEVSEYFEGVSKDFKSKYGIELEFTPLRATEITAKVKAEAAAGKRMGDYAQGGSSYMRELNQEGYFEYYVPPALQEPGIKWLLNVLGDKDDPAFAGKGLQPTVAMRLLGAAINPRLVPRDKWPKSYKDFAVDPLWKGKKIITSDPRKLGEGQITLYYLDRLYGREDPKILEKFAAQDIVFSDSTTTAIRDVAAGLYSVMIGARYSWVQALEPAPVEMWYSQEGVNASITLGSIVKGSPHLNAAKLFMNYQLSKDGQDKSTNLAGMTPIRGDVKAAYEQIDASKYKILPERSYNEEKNVLPKYLDIAKKLWPTN